AVPHGRAVSVRPGRHRQTQGAGRVALDGAGHRPSASVDRSVAPGDSRDPVTSPMIRFSYEYPPTRTAGRLRRRSAQIRKRTRFELARTPVGKTFLYGVTPSRRPGLSWGGLDYNGTEAFAFVSFAHGRHRVRHARCGIHFPCTERCRADGANGTCCRATERHDHDGLLQSGDEHGLECIPGRMGFRRFVFEYT